MPTDIILHGDVYACLDSLENESISVAITSPPYWNKGIMVMRAKLDRKKNPKIILGD